MRISLGNKIIGAIGLAGILILAVLIVVSYFTWVLLGISALLISFYSLFASFINYIQIAENEIIISNLFRKDKRKELDQFKEVKEIIPLTQLMRIIFLDGHSYVFFGKSESDLNRAITKKRAEFIASTSEKSEQC